MIIISVGEIQILLIIHSSSIHRQSSSRSNSQFNAPLSNIGHDLRTHNDRLTQNLKMKPIDGLSKKKLANQSEQKMVKFY